MDNNEMSFAEEHSDDVENFDKDLESPMSAATPGVATGALAGNVEKPVELSRNDRARDIIAILQECLKALDGMGRNSVTHINAVNNLKQCIKEIENDNRL